MKPFVTTFLVCLLLAGIHPTAESQTYDVPLSVMAAADGSFQVPFSVTAAGGNYFFASYSVQNIDNTNVSTVADCFCGPGCELLDGESFNFTEFGNLINPVVGGRIQLNVSACSSQWGSFSGEVEILPFDPTPTEDTSWSRIKRLLATR